MQAHSPSSHRTLNIPKPNQYRTHNTPCRLDMTLCVSSFLRWLMQTRQSIVSTVYDASEMSGTSSLPVVPTHPHIFIRKGE